MVKEDLGERSIKRFKSGEVHTLLGNRLHSFSGRASLVEPLNGLKIWHKNGQKHRDGDKPAYVKLTTSRNSTLSERVWYSKSVKHRDNDKPASITVQVTYTSEHERIVLREEKWFKDDILHRDNDKPAVRKIQRAFNLKGELFNEIKIEEYYKDGIKHRANNRSALIKRSKDIAADGSMVCSNLDEYYFEGERHRNGDRPAIKENIYEVDSNGNKIPGTSMSKYCRKGIIHRDGDKPAVIIIKKNFNGGIYFKEEVFLKNGTFHRDNDKKAYYLFDQNKIINAYYHKGSLHREADEPAVKYIDLQNQIIYYDFYKNDVLVTHDSSLEGSYFRKLLMSEFNNLTLEECESYPLSQVRSIINASGIFTYVNGVRDNTDALLIMRRSTVLF